MKLDGFESGYVRVDGHRPFYRSRGESTKGTVIVFHGGRARINSACSLF